MTDYATLLHGPLDGAIQVHGVGIILTMLESLVKANTLHVDTTEQGVRISLHYQQRKCIQPLRHTLVLDELIPYCRDLPPVPCFPPPGPPAQAHSSSLHEDCWSQWIDDSVLPRCELSESNTDVSDETCLSKANELQTDAFLLQQDTVRQSLLKADHDLNHAEPRESNNSVICDPRGSIAELSGDWFGINGERITVGGRACTFSCPRDVVDLHVLDQDVTVNDWTLAEIRSDGSMATWFKGEKQVNWLRSQPLAMLCGHWHSDEFNAISVQGYQCTFDDDAPDDIQLLGCTVTVNGWHLQGFSPSRMDAYWTKGDERVHWVRGCTNVDEMRATASENSLCDGNDHVDC